MHIIETNDLRQLQLEIMQSIHDFCTANNIHYSISGGTLLGAVRHEGYIPWDDDINCMMPRPDYSSKSGDNSNSYQIPEKIHNFQFQLGA